MARGGRPVQRPGVARWVRRGRREVVREVVRVLYWDCRDAWLGRSFRSFKAEERDVIDVVSEERGRSGDASEAVTAVWSCDHWAYKVR